MPTYSYHCNSCDNQFDVVRSMSNKAHQPCLLCGWLDRKEYKDQRANAGKEP